MSKKKSDLLPRLATAVVAIPILLYVIFAAPKWAFFILIAWAATTSVWEYMSITCQDEAKGGKALTTALGLGVFSTMYWLPEQSLLMLCGSAIAIFLFFLFRHDDQKRVTHLIGSSITAIIYGAVFMGLLALVNRDTGTAGPFWILLTLSIVWMSDTGAYFSGRAFGKRKLYEAVSPNKSVEGAIGGFFSSIGIAFALNAGFTAIAGESGYSSDLFGLSFAHIELGWKELTATQVLLIAIPGNILGQTGDLAESLVKRAHGVKDSGTIIYGHGGILDRIDALIFASPWIYYCATTVV